MNIKIYNKNQNKKMRNNFTSGMIIFIIFFIYVIPALNFNNSYLNDNHFMNNPRSSVSHEAISISSDAGFELICPSEQNGTIEYPYIIENLEITDNNEGISISNTEAYVIIQNCTIDASPGINLFQAENIVIRNNTLIGGSSGHGIYVANYCHNLVIANNSIKNFNIGMEIRYSDYAYIYGNNCTGNGYRGILLVSCDNGEILGNYFSGNGDTGFYMQFLCYNNYIIGNTIDFNDWYGMRIDNCQGNYIFLNNFIGNNVEEATEDSNSLNNYNNATMGNYYSDYEDDHPSASINPDGITWDTSQGIGFYSDDDYPLVNEFFFTGNEDYFTPEWAPWPQSQTLDEGESLYYDINATDNVAIDEFWLNNTDTFSISSEGILTNISELIVGTYFLRINVNDTTGNERTSVVQIIINPIDYEVPYWIIIPQDLTVPYGQTVSYDVHAVDNVAISQYWLSTTSIFTINSGGIISNQSILTSGDYPLTIFVNDSSGRENSTSIIITIEDPLPPEDTEDPYWMTIPQDLTVPYGQAVSYDVHAVDNVAISQYWLSSTSVFSISSGGIISNQSIIASGDYSLTIFVNDSSGRENSTSIIITIDDPLSPGNTDVPTNIGTTSSEETSNTDDGFGIPGYISEWIFIISIITIGGMIFIIRKKKIRYNL